jgi:hypothetical protein
MAPWDRGVHDQPTRKAIELRLTRQPKKALGSSSRQRERFRRISARLKATRVRGMAFFSLTLAANAGPSQYSEMCSQINFRPMRSVTSQNSRSCASMSDTAIGQSFHRIAIRCSIPGAGIAYYPSEIWFACASGSVQGHLRQYGRPEFFALPGASTIAKKVQ